MFAHGIQYYLLFPGKFFNKKTTFSEGLCSKISLSDFWALGPSDMTGRTTWTPRHDGDRTLESMDSWDFLKAGTPFMPKSMV